MFLAEVLHNDAHLIMVWDVNDACPGHFLQIFRPISKVTFITNDSRIFFTNNALKIYPNSRNGFAQTMLEYDVNLIVKKSVWWSAELSLYDKFIPTREIDEIVEAYAYKHNVCNITSMHIRKTDLDIELPPKRPASMEQYFRWVDRQPIGEPVYLMTDNPKTQRLFLNKYGLNKIFVYKNISLNEQENKINSIFYNNNNQLKTIKPKTFVNPNKKLKNLQNTTIILSHNNSAYLNVSANSTITIITTKKLALDHRFTTLEHALIDILIAAHAKDFRISAFSSVKTMNYLHRWKWCNCTFQGC
jgi:hypothetical protein